jgi:hypothetical protein
MLYKCNREGCGKESDNVSDFVVSATDVVCLECTEKELAELEARDQAEPSTEPDVETEVFEKLPSADPPTSSAG